VEASFLDDTCPMLCAPFLSCLFSISGAFRRGFSHALSLSELSLRVLSSRGRKRYLEVWPTRVLFTSTPLFVASRLLFPDFLEDRRCSLLLSVFEPPPVCSRPFCSLLAMTGMPRTDSWISFSFSLSPVCYLSFPHFFVCFIILDLTSPSLIFSVIG